MMRSHHVQHVDCWRLSLFCHARASSDKKQWPPGALRRRVYGAVPCYWRLVVNDWGGTHRARCLSLAPGQTVEAYPGVSLIWQSLLGKNYLLVCLVAVVMSPVPVAPIPIAPIAIASVVWVCIHDARLGDHDRRWRHKHGRWLHDYGTRSDDNRRWWGDDCHWQR